MPSASIDIQSGYSCTKSFGIDTTMPAILKGRVTDAQWKSFCDEVDAHLQPLNRTTRCFLFSSIGLFVAFLVIMIVSFMTFTSGSVGTPIFAIFIIPFILILGMMGFSMYIAGKFNDTLGKIDDVCKETSKKQPLVSYHFRNEVAVSSNSRRRYRNVYIEVSISDQPVHNTYSAPVATAYAVPASSTQSPYVTNGTSNVIASSGATDTAGRLQELEKIKHLLTPQEYDDKRAEILASV